MVVVVVVMVMMLGWCSVVVVMVMIVVVVVELVLVWWWWLKPVPLWCGGHSLGTTGVCQSWSQCRSSDVFSPEVGDKVVDGTGHLRGPYMWPQWPLDCF